VLATHYTVAFRSLGLQVSLCHEVVGAVYDRIEIGMSVSSLLRSELSIFNQDLSRIRHVLSETADLFDEIEMTTQMSGGRPSDAGSLLVLHLHSYS